MGRDPSESRILSGRRPVLELLRSGHAPERILFAQDMKPAAVTSEIRKRALEAGVGVRVVPRAEIDRLAPGANHQGVVALTARFRYTPLEEILDRPSPSVLFLDGLTDPHNLGSLIRTADGAGFDGVVIPARRSVAVTDAVRRVAAGGAEHVPIARVANLGGALDQARSAGLWLIGLDADATEELWGSRLAEPPVGVVLGAEERGLSQNISRRCDALLRIPLKGRLESLNVAVAGAITMFEVARRRDDSDTLYAR